MTTSEDLCAIYQGVVSLAVLIAALYLLFSTERIEK